jgi:hypothetical protein
MFTYILEGKILPETQPFPDYHAELQAKNPDIPLDCKLNLQIINSKINCEANSEKEILDLQTLRNVIKDIIFLQTSIVGYIKGCYYDIELDLLIDFETQKKVTFNSGIDQLATDSANRPISNPSDIMEWFKDPRYSFLRTSLQDLTLSIKYPKDTGFFCYRAIESIRNFFDESDDKKGWNLLRNNLRISRSFIESVKHFADEQRHGGLMFLTSKNRIDIMISTWKIVDRFIIFVKNGNRPLDKSTYTEL